MITISNKNFYIDKISSIVRYVCKNLVLKHNVSLGRKNELSKKRDYYYSEYIYKSNKYLDFNEIISAKVNISYYLSLESISKDEEDNKAFFMINEMTLFKLIKEMKKLVELFYVPDLYLNDPLRGLVMNASYNETKFGIKVGNNTLVMYPSVIDYEDAQYEGIVLIIDGQYKYNITVDNFMLLYRILSRMNLYEASLNLVNIIGIPDGTKNLYKFDGGGNKNGSHIDKSVKNNITSNDISNRKIGGVSHNSLEDVFSFNKKEKIKIKI